jgi:hypothetical protein
MFDVQPPAGPVNYKNGVHKPGAKKRRAAHR